MSLTAATFVQDYLIAQVPFLAPFHVCLWVCRQASFSISLPYLMIDHSSSAAVRVVSTVSINIF